MTLSLSFLIIAPIRLFFPLLSFGIRFFVPEISSYFVLITYSKLQVDLGRYLCTSASLVLLMQNFHWYRMNYLFTFSILFTFYVLFIDRRHHPPSRKSWRLWLNLLYLFLYLFLLLFSSWDRPPGSSSLSRKNRIIIIILVILFDIQIGCRSIFIQTAIDWFLLLIEKLLKSRGLLLFGSLFKHRK